MIKNNVSSYYNLGITTINFNIFLFFACFVFTVYAADIAHKEQTITAQMLAVVSIVFIFVFLLFAIIETNTSKIVTVIGLALLSVGGISSLYYHPSDEKLKFVCTNGSCEEVVWRNPFAHSHANTIDRNLGSDQIQANATSKDGARVMVLLMSDYNIVDSKKFLSAIAKVIPKNRIKTRTINEVLEREIIYASRRYIEQKGFEEIKKGELEVILERMVNPLKLKNKVTVIDIIDTDG